eukprot:jgi/Galph1/4737/GphlegSOOS_G3349.1
MTSRLGRVLDFIAKLRNTFETHRTVFTVGGTLLSASAAWAGYVTRSRYQVSIEKKLEAIQSQIESPTKRKRIKNSGLEICHSFFTVTLAFGYFLGWRKGRLQLWEKLNKDPAIAELLKERERARQSQQSSRFRRPMILLSRARMLWNAARSKAFALTSLHASPASHLQRVSSVPVGKASEANSSSSLISRVGRRF